MDEKKNGTTVETVSVRDGVVKMKVNGHVEVHQADDALLAELGYKSEFKVRVYYSGCEIWVSKPSLARIFCSSTFRFASPSERLIAIHQIVETVAFSISIMGVVASVSSTFSFVLISGSSQALNPPFTGCQK
jgi:hypothetical protein